MHARGLIHHLCDDSQRPSGGPVAVLGALQEGPANASELARACSISPSTVATNCKPFVEAEFLTHDGEYEFTGAGLVFFDCFEDATETLTPGEIAALSVSEHRLPILRSIAETPGRKSDLQHRDGLPSRTTIEKAVTEFGARDWVSENITGKLSLTDAGRTAMVTYEEFFDSTEAVQATTPFLRRLGKRSPTIPIAALTDATPIEESQYHADALADAVLQLTEGVSRSRSITGLVSTYSPVLLQRFATILEDDIEYRFLLDAETAQRVRSSPYRHVVETALERPEADIRVYQEALPFGFVTDGERIVVGAYGSPHEYPAGLVSTNEALVGWALDVHASYWEEAESLSFESTNMSARRRSM
jgi:predicted transcriptional regulator